MTTIIMVEHENGVTIGYDSKVSNGYRVRELEAPKVFSNAGMVFGFAGAVLDAQLIKYAELPEITEDEWDTDRWVTNELVPWMAMTLKDREAATVSNSKLLTDNNALVVVRGRVYQIGADTSWIRLTSGIYAIGSGSAYALGALHTGSSVRDSLEVAANLDGFTGFDLHVKQHYEFLGGK